MNIRKPLTCDPEETPPCCWWVLCENQSTQTLSHPILGDVPICDRCLQKCKDLGMDVQEEIHHLAFNKQSEGIPMCGASLTGAGLSLEADKVTCGLCRRICGLDIQ